MVSTLRAGGEDIRLMMQEAVQRLPVHPDVHGHAELRRVRVLGAEIAVDCQQRMLTTMLVPLPGEDERSLPLRDFCIADLWRPFSLGDVEQALERQLRIAARKCKESSADQIGLVERGLLLQVAREWVDLDRINRETIAALDLDADILAIAALLPRIGSEKIDGHWYSKIWREAESLGELLHHAPNLLPLGYVGLVNGCLWGGGDILKEIKGDLRRAGLSRKEWRDLIRLPRQTIDALIPALSAEEAMFGHFAAAFSVYRLAQEVGPPGFAEYLAQKQAGSLHELPPVVMQIMAIGARERLTAGVIRDFFDDDFVAVCTWLREDGPRLNSLRNLDWRGLVERARIYEMDMFGPLGEDMSRNLSWESALPEHVEGGYRFVPLTSSQALREEGEAMKHCVAQYDVDCVRGKSRIFSVLTMRTGKRVATVELYIDDLLLGKKWFVRQVRGEKNSNIGIRVKSATENLAKRYALGNLRC